MARRTPSHITLVYGVRMKSQSGGGKMLNLLASIALMLSALASWGAQLHSHCASHTVPTRVVTHESHSAHQAAAWTSESGHECDHCPPADCSRVASCATSMSVALGAAVAPILALLTHRVGPSAEFGPPPMILIQPPTPPPQTLS